MNNLGLIENSITQRREIIIQYIDRKGVYSKRRVEPYEIKNGKLYAYCLVKNGIRAFDLNNISSIEVTDLHFTPRY